MNKCDPRTSRVRRFNLPDAFMVYNCRIKRLNDIRDWDDVVTPLKFVDSGVVWFWGGREFLGKKYEDVVQGGV